MDLVLFLDSDNVLELEAIDGVTKTRFNIAATVQVTGLFPVGSTTPVTGQTWPLTLSYIAAGTGGLPTTPDPTGIYRGTIEYDVVIDRTKRYYATVFFDGGAGKRRTVRYNVIFKGGQNP
jgi:hypothetical protein